MKRSQGGAPRLTGAPGWLSHLIMRQTHKSNTLTAQQTRTSPGWCILRLEVVRVTSALTDSEVEGRAGLWRDAEVDLVVLSSLVSVDGSQNLDYLPHTNQNVTDIFMLTPFL